MKIILDTLNLASAREALVRQAVQDAPDAAAAADLLGISLPQLARERAKHKIPLPAHWRRRRAKP